MMINTKVKNSNCKLMGRRLLYYDIAKTRDKIMVNLEEYHNFLLTSYKGMFCVACDYYQN